MNKNLIHGISIIFLALLTFSCSSDDNMISENNSKKGKPNGTIPDYGPTVFVSNSTVIGSEVVDFNVLIAEYNNVNNDPNGQDIVLLIKKEPGLVVSFDQNLTSSNGQTVANNNWNQIYESSSYYYYSYVGNNGVFPAGSAHFIGFNAVLTCLGKGDTIVEAVLKSYSGGQINTLNDSDIDIITCNAAALPDFTPELIVSENIFNSGNSSNFSVVTQIENIGGDSNGTPIELRIVKSSNFSFNYDNTLTIVDGVAVNNSNWSYDGSHPALHKFVYLGSSVFNGISQSSIGLNATYNCPSNSNSVQPLKATVKYNSGGEQNNQNNNDVEYLECSL